MAGKVKVKYVCNSCGYQTSQWMGRCSQCGEWNSFSEEIDEATAPKNKKISAVSQSVLQGEITRLNDVSTDDEIRYKTGLSELDRVLGGGIVKGSLVLLGGDPGIGKSTLLLQICDCLCCGLKVMYFSGEESIRQIKLRADRLGVNSDNLFVISSNSMDSISQMITTSQPDLVIVDSIQTVSLSMLSSSPGSITQVRECTQELMRIAKYNNIAVLVIGHVNKDGAIAGPKVLEHIVDAVLYFEGERNFAYRILRAVKNRFGSTNEIGMFEMQSCGLVQVENPSQYLLEERPKNTSGSCVACVVEGSCPIMSEVQALVTKTAYSVAKRTSTGFDYNRMYLLIAVLEKRAGFFIGNLDVYINVVGGFKLDEPAADLPVLLSIYSGLKDKPIPDTVAAFGEIGLSGEVRSVTNALARINEVKKLGFKTCILPKQNLKNLAGHALPSDIELIGVSNIKEAFAAVG